MEREEHNVKDLEKTFKSNNFLKIGIGHATYTMSRGSFKTKDKIKITKKLHFIEVVNDEYRYALDGVELVMRVQKSIHKTTLQFFCSSLDYNRFWATIPSHSQQGIFGCGEQFTHFNLKGKKVPIWVSEHHSLKKLLKKAFLSRIFGVNDARMNEYSQHQTYIAQPTFITSDFDVIHSKVSDYCEFDFTSPSHTLLGFRTIPQEIIIFHSNNPRQCMQAITLELGKHPKMPSWVLDGAIVASQGGWIRVDTLIERIKRKNGAITAIWSQDFSGALRTKFGSQVYWNWQHDPSLYPDAKNKIQSLREQGIRFLGYINPFLKEHAPLYQEAMKAGYLVMNQQHQPYLVKSTTFNAGLIDLTNPLAYMWTKTLIQKEMIDMGLSGWMVDFGEYLPTDALIYDPKGATFMHNCWPDLWAQCNREAIAERKLEDEIFIFNRAGFTLTHTMTNSMWAGDQHVDFSLEYGLPSVVVAMLSLGVIGKGIVHSDIGGYTTIFHMKRDEELMLRWIEMNVFSPVYRTHEGNRPQNNVQVDTNKKVLHHFSLMSSLFKQLKPYHEHVLNEYAKDGLPCVRPMFFVSDDPIAITLQYQYMYGDSLVVAPVIARGQKQINVWLPHGEWFKLFSNDSFSSGWVCVDCPIGKPIAFYKHDDTWSDFFAKLSDIYT